VPLASWNSQTQNATFNVLPHSGTVYLHRGEAGKTADDPVISAHAIAANQKLTFALREGRGLAALAGEHEIPLADGSYYWSLAPGSELSGLRLWWHHHRPTRAGTQDALKTTSTGVVVGAVFVGVWALATACYAIGFALKNQ
jgi:hypothetical protein